MSQAKQTRPSKAAAHIVAYGRALSRLGDALQHPERTTFTKLAKLAFDAGMRVNIVIVDRTGKDVGAIVASGGHAQFVPMPREQKAAEGAARAPDRQGQKQPAKAKGGHARASKLTAEQRSEIARKGALKRWAKVKKKRP